MRGRLLVLLMVACHAKRPRPAPICEGAPPEVSSATGRQVVQVPHSDSVSHVAVGEGGLLATTDGVEVKIWDLDRSLLLRTLELNRSLSLDPSGGIYAGGIWGVAWSGRDRLVVKHYDPSCEGCELSLVEYDLTGRELQTLSDEWRIMDNAGGSQLIRSTNDGVDLIMQLPGHDEVRVPWPPDVDTIQYTAISRDGSAVGLVVADGEDSVLHIWDLDEAEPVERRFEIQGIINSIDLLDDGEHAWMTETVPPSGYRIWSDALIDTNTGAMTARDDLATEGWPFLTSDGRSIVGYDLETGVTRIARPGAPPWRWRSARDYRQLGYASDGGVTAAWFPSGVVIAAIADNSLVLLDPDTGAVRGRLGAAVDTPAGVFAVDDHSLLVVQEQQIVRWDLDTARATWLGRGFGEIYFSGMLAVKDDTLIVGGQSGDDFFLYAGHLDELPVHSFDDMPVHDWPATSSWPPPLDREGTQWRVPGDVAGVSMELGLVLTSVPGRQAEDGLQCAVLDLRGGKPRPLEGFAMGCDDRYVGPDDVEGPIDVWGRYPELVFAGEHIVGVWFELDRVEVAMWDARGRREVSASLPLPSERGGASYGDVEVHSRTIFQPALTARGDAIVAWSNVARWRIEIATGEVTEASPDELLSSARVTTSPDGTWSAQAGEGSVAILRGESRVATLVAFQDQEYLAFTSEGYYAGTPDVGERVAWAFDDPLEAATFEQYAALFNRPDLVVRRLAGATSGRGSTARRPPSITIAPPIVENGHAHVAIHASSPGRVDLVRVLDDGAPVSTQAICAAEGDAFVDVILHAGINRISAVAYDDAGLASEVASIDVRGPASATAPKVWVVAVGVSEYPNLSADEQLEASDDDARAIAAAFRGQVARGAFGDADVVELIDRDATADRVLDALRRLDQMAPDDLAVVFFAGHGVKPDDADTGEMVFLTTNSTVERLDESIRWADVATALGGARGRVLLLLDACHAGHFSRPVAAASEDLASSFVTDGRAGAVVFSAAKGAQLSYEPTGVRAIRRRQRDDLLPALPEPAAGATPHGLFTAALLSTLDAPETDLDTDGELELSEWIFAVREEVGRASQGLQTPWVAHREILGELKIGATHAR